MTDGEANTRAICAKGKCLNRMKMDRPIQKESSELGQGDGHRNNHTTDLRH